MNTWVKTGLRGAIGITLIVALAACGGGGGKGNKLFGGGGSDEPIADWQSGVFPASSQLAASCALPRSGTDINGNSFADKSGTAADEKMWLRSWSDELYLWYSEIPDQNPASYGVAEYFDELKTTQLTPSGAAKDNFHFSVPTDEWLLLSQSGISSGYGARWAIENTDPRTIRVVYTEPGSPAAIAGLERGAELLTVDGVSVTSTSAAGVDTLNAGLFPSASGESHQFIVIDLGASESRSVTLNSADVTSIPVQFTQTFTTDSHTVGYLLFNDHIATAEAGLFTAINTLADANVTELIIDMRYNGGGFLAIASQLAYMVAGSTATSGRVFESLQFNDKNPNTNPVTGGDLTPTPFIDQTIDFSLSAGQPLPTLNLDRVVVITGSGTCSASEAVINGLRGVDIDVIQIGKTTCGKPYGFYAADNCGTSWFSIQFQGVNDKGFGEYPDGFAPANSSDAFGVSVPGCDVSDDLGHAFTDPEERRIAAALTYLETGSCPSTLASKPGLQKLDEGDADLHLLGGSPALQNRIMKVLP